jgi:antitoxin component YwqK of YwqJK toxin-antitoxin module
MILKAQKLILIFIAVQFCHTSDAQYKTYTLSVHGDTLNAIDKNGLKQGKWVLHTDELRGEPGYEEEGIFVNNKREGLWRKYTLHSDLIAVENYKYGGKDGLCQYYTPLGELVREENWRAYNPDEPYDTIPVYGTGSNEILSYKILKAEQYSVKDGNWTYYEPSSGIILKTEKYDRGHLNPEQKTQLVSEEPKKVAKPAEVLDYEKKNSGKKKVKVRDGQTGN